VRKWLPGLLILADLAFTLAVYDRLPDRIATHFGVNGPDQWSGRANAAFLLPAIALGVWGLMRGLPRIDPRRLNYEAFRSGYDLVVLGAVLLVVLIHVSLLANALGWPAPVERMVPFVVGGLIVLVGSVLPRAKSTWFFGIRTPWTLSNDEVWARTHRVGGPLMMASGVMFMLLAFVRTPVAMIAVVTAAALTGLATVPYSYFVWREVTAGKG